MDITVFDGEVFTLADTDEALVATRVESPGRSVWIDARVDDVGDIQVAEFLRALDVDPAEVVGALSCDLELTLRLTFEGIQGVVWLDDNNGTPSSVVFFQWNRQRLLTVRLGGEQGMRFVRKRLLERLPAVGQTPLRLLSDTLGLMLVTVQRGLTDVAVRVGELNQEILETARPNAEQRAELAAYRSVFHSLSLRFPGYLVNAHAALIDPPDVGATDFDEVELLRSYVKSVDNTQILIDSVESSIRNVSRDLQAQTASWQGRQVNVLTAMAAVFIPITFITSYFGMNFDWMIGEVSSMGHFLFFGVGLLLFVSLVAISVLRRSGYSLTIDQRTEVERARKRILRPFQTRSGTGKDK